MVDVYCDSHDAPPEAVTLDIDDTLYAAQAKIKARGNANGWPLPERKGSAGLLSRRGRGPTMMNNLD